MAVSGNHGSPTVGRCTQWCRPATAILPFGILSRIRYSPSDNLRGNATTGSTRTTCNRDRRTRNSFARTAVSADPMCRRKKIRPFHRHWSARTLRSSWSRRVHTRLPARKYVFNRKLPLTIAVRRQHYFLEVPQMRIGRALTWS